jgi:hypothetical protein
MTNRFESRFVLADEDIPPEQRKVRKPSAFDIVSKLLLPIALAFVAIFRLANPRLLLAFAAIALVVSFSDVLLHGARSILTELHDRRVARRNSRELGRFSREIGSLLDSNRTDTLHSILGTFSQQHADLSTVLRVPEANIFYTHWYYMNERIARGRFNAVRFHESAEEFHSLVISYGSYCVRPIFETFAAQLRDSLTANEKSHLNAFQQRYVTFATGYSKFLSELNEEFRTIPKFLTGVYLPRPI